MTGKDSLKDVQEREEYLEAKDGTPRLPAPVRGGVVGKKTASKVIVCCMGRPRDGGFEHFVPRAGLSLGQGRTDNPRLAPIRKIAGPAPTPVLGAAEGPPDYMLVRRHLALKSAKDLEI